MNITVYLSSQDTIWLTNLSSFETYTNNEGGKNITAYRADLDSPDDPDAEYIYAEFYDIAGYICD
jgi:hypothetical protein